MALLLMHLISWLEYWCWMPSVELWRVIYIACSLCLLGSLWYWYSNVDHVSDNSISNCLLEMPSTTVCAVQAWLTWSPMEQVFRIFSLQPQKLFQKKLSRTTFLFIWKTSYSLVVVLLPADCLSRYRIFEHIDVCTMFSVLYGNVSFGA